MPSIYTCNYVIKLSKMIMHCFKKNIGMNSVDFPDLATVLYVLRGAV